MRLILLALALAFLGMSAGTQRAKAYYNEPWCLSLGGTEDCSYSDFNQCNASRIGNGGSCYPNPRLPSQPRQGRPRIFGGFQR